MTKRSKLAILLAGMCFVLPLAGCFEDYIPDSYGEWEGYYVYSGNYRSKTTGEDGEQLIQTLTVDGEEYEVSSCTDSMIFGDEMYVCLRLIGKYGESFTCLAAYDMAAKTQRLIYRERTLTVGGDEEIYSARRILKVCTDRIFMQKDYGVFCVDQTGAIIDDGIDGLSYFERADEYLYRWKDGNLIYRTWTDETEKVAVEQTLAPYMDAEFIQKDGKKGFLITASTQSDGMDALYFYNLKTETLSEISGLPSGGIEWVTCARNREYFLSYQEKTITYEEAWDLFETVTQTKTVQVDCTLWRLDYSNAVPTVTQVYTFDEKKSYTGLIGVDDEYCHVRASWYETARGCNGGGERNEFLRIHLATGEEKKYRNEEVLREAVAACESLSYLDSGVTLGNYTYYVEWHELSPGFFGPPSYVYQFKRTDGKTVDVMQLWASYPEEDDHYFAEMWGGQMWEDEDYAATYSFAVRAD